MQEEIFDAFKKSINAKLNQYFFTFGFNCEIPFKEDSQWISKVFIRQEDEIIISLSLHHLDYADGIQVILKTKFGQKVFIQKCKNIQKPKCQFICIK